MRTYTIVTVTRSRHALCFGQRVARSSAGEGHLPQEPSILSRGMDLHVSPQIQHHFVIRLLSHVTRLGNAPGVFLAGLRESISHLAITTIF
jgi:hypothetical protein